MVVPTHLAGLIPTIRKLIRKVAKPRTPCHGHSVEALERRSLLSTATFSATIYPIEGIARYTTLADFNGDGRPDIAAAITNSTQVGIMLNNGDGTFARPTYLNAGIPRSVAAADFFHTGVVDLAVAGENGSNAIVRIFQGVGDGTFVRPPQHYPLAGGGQYMVAADVNGDGWADLVVTGSSRVAVLINNRDGTFAPPVYYNAGGNHPSALAVADFNNDGVPDIAVARGAQSEVTILLGSKTAPGTFGPPLFYPTGGNPLDLTVGDFNHDGNLDLAVVNSQFKGNTVAVLLGNGDGSFRPPQLYTTPANFSDAIVAGDFSGNGIQDLVVGSFDGALKLFPGNGDGTFAPPMNIPNGLFTQFLRTGDLNGDGKLDLVATPYLGVRVLLNTTGTVPPPTTGSGTDQTIGEGGPRSSRFYTPDGTLTTIALNGPGAAQLHFSSSTSISIPQAKSSLEVTGLQLASITATGTTSASTLSMSVSGGSRTVTLDSITTDGGFGAIEAPRTNLTNVLQLPAGARKISLLSADNGTISIGGGPLPILNLGQTSGETLNSAVPINAMRVALDCGIHLTAPSVNSFAIGGNLHDATITLTAPAAAGVYDLGNLSVTRGIVRTTVNSSGSIATISALYMNASTIEAGVGPLPPGQSLPAGPGDFTSTATIKTVSLATSPRQPSFSSSNIAAAQLINLTLGTIQLNNAGIPFGVAAHTLDTLSGTDLATGRSFRLKNVTSTAAAASALQARGINPQDFVVRII